MLNEGMLGPPIPNLTESGQELWNVKYNFLKPVNKMIVTADLHETRA